MIALWEDADVAPTHAISVDRADLDMLHEAMSALMVSTRAVAARMPDQAYYAYRAERARRLNLALAKHIAGIRNAQREAAS